MRFHNTCRHVASGRSKMKLTLPWRCATLHPLHPQCLTAHHPKKHESFHQQRSAETKPEHTAVECQPLFFFVIAWMFVIHQLCETNKLQYWPEARCALFAPLWLDSLIRNLQWRILTQGDSRRRFASRGVVNTSTYVCWCTCVYGRDACFLAWRDPISWYRDRRGATASFLSRGTSYQKTKWTNEHFVLTLVHLSQGQQG